MIRTLWVVFSTCCVAAILSELLGVGVLWSQGQLSSKRLRDLRDVFGPQEKETTTIDAEAQPIPPSSQDVLRERSLRVLSLSSLETEVGLLKNMLDNERNGLGGQMAEFQKDKAAFKAQLQQLSDENNVAAREQARAVLLALAPTEAVDRLMQLSVEEDVLLLREMPEAKIALILKEFSPEGGETANPSKEMQARIQRGRDVFDKITKGEPRDSIIRSALNKLQPTEGEHPASPGTR